jgi:Spy/CpxP family protein refolding chaperone
MGGHHHGGWLGKKLNLTDTQKNNLETYRRQHKAELRTALAGVVAAKLKIQQDIDANDQTAITADATALGQAVAQLGKERAAELNYLKGILNPDQVAAWQGLQQKRQTRMQDRLDQLNQSSS